MKPRQLFILMLIFLLATTLLFPKTEEQKYCHQFSGESNKDEASAEFNSCKLDDRCQIDQESILPKEIDQDTFSFMCIPINNNSKNGKDLPQQFPK